MSCAVAFQRLSNRCRVPAGGTERGGREEEECTGLLCSSLHQVSRLKADCFVHHYIKVLTKNLQGYIVHRYIR